MSVEAVLERMRDAYRARDLGELAEQLQMDETTFRVWRTRKQVPAKVLVKVSHTTGRSVTWLNDGYHTEQDWLAREPGVILSDSREKQINLTTEEKALLDNFRAASTEGRLAIATASAALAKPSSKLKKSA